MPSATDSPSATVPGPTAPGAPPAPCAAPRSESFTLGYAFAALHVDSRVPGVRELLPRVLGPAFATTDSGAGAPAGVLRLTVRLRGSEEPTAATVHGLERMPTLLLDGTRQVVLARTPEVVTVLQLAEEDATELLLTAHPGTGEVDLALPDGSPGALRAVARTVKFLVGAQLTAAGLPVFHGSAVARDGEGIVVVGPSGSGKSSLMFLVATRAGWDFVSDDLVFAWAGADGAPRMSGWSNRIGLSVATLSGHPARRRFEEARLRRYDQPIGPLDVDADRPWSRADRVRVYCDIDEFLEVARIGGAAAVRPRGVVVPVAERDRKGWEITVEEPGDLRWRSDFDANIRQLKHVTDFLGLVPRPATAGNGAVGVGAALDAMPVVRARYGRDMLDDVPRFWAEVTEALQRARR
ncbi:hypothetical protein [Streptomyces sp. HF10]|uniref:hypothetical protein n=1 Tax=Streptomyces sp. HF10 TaxID=2692233 RepID=UPI001316221E|nr:hypothetical protein [Streptomyces sp. HF10]QHC32652.1 hypothetical protein GR129_31640 [Streptomyces sp. HF10]